MSPPVSTSELHTLLERFQAGDRAALDELLTRVRNRLEQLTRRMLRDFQTVRRWADTDDVLQNALLRLSRFLEQWHPGSTRDFYHVAAMHLRRELLDLARYHARRERGGLLPAEGAPLPDALEDPSSDLERWCAFHEAVEGLPEELREVVALRFYHGWTVAQVAEFLKISERTVIRRWQTALWLLAEQCGE